VRALLGEWVAAACAVLIAGVATGPGHDTGVLVPPPEAAAENFLKAMAEHRYPQARQHLAARLETTAIRELAEVQRALEQALGPVRDVRGEDAETDGEDSRARVSIAFRDAECVCHLQLSRERGLWKVASLDPLLGLAAGCSAMRG
jgi:hypothetical protein